MNAFGKANDETLFLDVNALFFLQGKGNTYEGILSRLKKLGPVAVDVKGLMEIVYRYHLMGETAKGYEHAELLRGQTRVLSVTGEDLKIQDSLLHRYPNVPARELLHAAVMIHNGMRNVICSPESSYAEMQELRPASVLGRLGEL